MKISRKNLVQLCDKFLNNEINKIEIENFASTLMFSDELDWDDEDEILSKTIFEWDNEDINFRINKVNMRLWKNRLENNIDELMEHNFWNTHIEKQKEICANYNSKWNPINPKLKIGASIDLNLDPLNGIRQKGEKGTTGWFIWSGEFSENKDFFQPICAENLLQIRPQIIKYLGLDVGFRLLIDNNGYENVWFDENIKDEM
jgi:hypothetical protein